MMKFIFVSSLFVMVLGSFSCQTVMNTATSNTSSSQPSLTSSLVQGLVGMLGKSDSTQKQSAMSQIVQMGSKAVPYLMTVLKGKNTPAIKDSLSLLGKIGPQAGAAKEDVKKLTTSKDPQVKAAAQVTLDRISAK